MDFRWRERSILGVPGKPVSESRVLEEGTYLIKCRKIDSESIPWSSDSKQQVAKIIYWKIVKYCQIKCILIFAS